MNKKVKVVLAIVAVALTLGVGVFGRVQRINPPYGLINSR